MLLNGKEHTIEEAKDMLKNAYDITGNVVTSVSQKFNTLEMKK